MKKAHGGEMRGRPGRRSFRETCKHVVPQMTHVVRLGRLLLNQVKFPIAGAVLDWEGKVQGGLFKGMRHARSGSAPYAVLLGTYELALAPIIEQVIARKPDLIVDVGASAGYYAMGFAWRCPTTKVVAYEADATRRALMAKYVRINGLTDRVDLRGLCTVEELKATLSEKTGAFLLMDVEGSEDALLTPEIPNIDRTEILVELHEMFVPGITQRLQERFSKTHHTTIIKQADLAGPSRRESWKRRLVHSGSGSGQRWRRNPTSIR
jgi:hypothetical protein